MVDDVAECETVYDEKCHQEQVIKDFFNTYTELTVIKSCFVRYGIQEK